MSQSGNPTDSQALLQSMLQRLKLQPGKEGQAFLHTPEPITTAPTWRQGGGQEDANVQTANSPVNRFECDTNGIPSKEFEISVADSNFGCRGVEIQQAGLGCEVDRGDISSPTQKSNSDGDKGQAMQPQITPSGTEQLFPAASLKDVDIISFERTSFGTSAITSPTTTNKDCITSPEQNQDTDWGFIPKAYRWSFMTTNSNVGTGSPEDKVFYMENGGFEALAQSNNVQIDPTDQITTNSSSRRKTSENKTRRWTQKIKERWRERPGSFGKKAKEEPKEEQKSKHGPEILPQNQLLAAGTLINTPKKEEERTPSSQDSSDSSKTLLTHTEDATNVGHMRSVSDFEFGLGSFSLLEEIATGQEWAKFLKPTQSDASANQRPSGELKILPNSHNGSQSSLSHRGGVINQWSFRGTEASPASDFSMAQMPPNAYLPASMDVSEGKPLPFVYKEADQSEPMEHGHTGQSVDSGPGQHLRARPSVQPADILNISALKSRAHLNRKRQHQSVEGRDERLQTDEISDVREADREGTRLSLSRTHSHPTEETGDDNVTPSHVLHSPPPPLFPYSIPPIPRVPKGVLKHSISQDSEYSMEVVTKRRRLEDNRRVRFSTEVVTIEPPEQDMDAADSEEDSVEEEDSLIEQEAEEEQAATEEVAPARRTVLPAWIRALKRRNTGRKHR